MKHFSDTKGFVRSLFYPDRCCFCGKVVPFSAELCDDCFENEKFIEYPRCHACGRSKKDCECKGHSNFYQGITAPYEYRSGAKRGIIRWKYKGAEHSVNFFAKRVARFIKKDFDTEKIDIITFVPQTAAERDERQFNQGEVLAVEVGKLLDIPVEPLLAKIFETRRQHDMPAYMKSGNIFGVFDCPDDSRVQGKTVLLVDDIKTSGKTLNECAKILHLYGAAAVYCAVVGIT